jgi:serine protease Do
MVSVRIRGRGARYVRTFTALVRAVSMGLVASLLAATAAVTRADPMDTIERVKLSVVAIGTYERTRNPAFAFRGTGFAIGDGSWIATNAHVLPPTLDAERRESLVAVLPGINITTGQARTARVLAVDRSNDLAILAIDGAKIPPLRITEGFRVREGQTLYFTGFPIGAVLGLIPVTHRGMVSALTPISIPTSDSSQLDAQAIRRLSSGASSVMQLDATAYPGNSGSPLYDPDTGGVVGILNSVFVKASRETLLSQPSGIAYALPVQWLLDLMKTVK